MSSRREERERLRQERLAAQQAAASSDRQRLILGYVVAGLIVVAIVAGIVVAITGGGSDGNGRGPDADYPELAYIQDDLGAVPDGVEPDGRDGTDPPPVEIGVLETAAEEAGCELRLDLPDEGATHFTDINKDPGYKTNPPTSGDHFFSATEAGSGAVADGAYLDPVPQVRVVHALEHGRVAIQYSPDLPEEDQLAIKGVFEESPQGVVLFPNPEMPYDVAITAWTDLAGCESYEGPATLDLLRAFRDIYRNQGPEPVPLSV